MLRWITVACLAGPCMSLAEPFPRPLQDEKINKLIVQFLQDKDAKKRRLALLELEIVGPRVKGVLQSMGIALEKDPEPVVRREVALALGRMGADAEPAIPALAFALKNDKDDTVREVSARALLQMLPHSARALQQLVEALQDSHGLTRAAAAETIKSLGEQAKSAVPQLIEYLKSPKDKKSDASARMHVALALGRVGEEGARGATVLTTVLSDPTEDVLVRVAAADSLGRFGLDAQGAAKPLADILGNTKNDQSLRLAAVKALAKVEGNTRLVWPALKVGLADGDAMVRILTIRAAGPYGKDEPEAVRILAKLARNDDNVEVRLAAIQELGLIGSAAKIAEPDLRYIIEHDERETVREQAEVAVKRIQGKSIP
jgi:HEAT repeat protein